MLSDRAPCARCRPVGAAELVIDRSLEAGLWSADDHEVIEATVRRWQRYGNDRLYVKARDGASVGWHDLLSGATHCEQPLLAELLTRTIAEWREANGFPSLSAQQSPPNNATSPDLPSPNESEVAGGGTDLADRPPGWGPYTRLVELSEDERRLNKPGELLQAQWYELRKQDRAVRSQAPLRHLLLAMRGRRTPERLALRDQMRATKDQLGAHRSEVRFKGREIAVESGSWRLGMDGEVIVGRLLAELVKRDPRWRVLHGIPVGRSGADIDHLVIGPSGVYTLNTKHHPRANVFVAHDAVLVNGTKYPYVRNARHEAERASRLLSSACRVRVRVSGVVVPVGVQKFVVKAQPRDVVVVPRGRLIEWLAAGPRELDSEAIETVYRSARRAATWGH
jgi:Nuclease-related domain